MAAKRPRPDNSFDAIFKPILLRSESAQIFKALSDEILHEIKPRTPIERIFTHQIVAKAGDIARYQQLRTGILNAGFLPAIQNLLAVRDPSGGVMTDILVSEYFVSPESCRGVREKLSQGGLTEADIDAEAFRIRADCLEKIDKLLASAESGLRKWFRELQDLRVKNPLAVVTEKEILPVPDADVRCAPDMADDH